MRSGSGRTLVKARELERGMIVKAIGGQLGGYGVPVGQAVTVESVEPARDAVARLQAEVAAARSRAKMQIAAQALVAVLNAIEYEGRGALLVRFVGLRNPVSFASSDEMRYVGFGSVESAAAA